MQNIVKKYLATWNASQSERAELLVNHWSPNVTYVDPQAEIHGHKALNELIQTVQAQFPNFVFSQLHEADGHHQQVRFSWGLGPTDGNPVLVGTDVVLLDEHGKILDVRGFLDTGPPENSRRGYVVGHLEEVNCALEIRRYMEQIECTFEHFGGAWLVHGDGSQPEVLEGPWSADTVIIVFPSLTAARDWYYSPAYQEILGLRTQHARSQVMLLEGVLPGYRAAETIAKLFDA